jgi:hypothetical protein
VRGADVEMTRNSWRFARVVAKLMRLPEPDVDSITGRQELFPMVHTVPR